MTLRPHPLLAVLVAAAAALGAAGTFLARRASQPELPVYGAVPAFALVDHHGRPLSARALLGRPWVADFIFTRCGGVCPAMTARLARLRKEVPAAAGFVSFTVDPDHDTSAVLADYARDFHAGDGWLFVTGTKPALYALATAGFKLEAFEVPSGQQQGGDGPFLHSSKVVLVDGAGRIRGYYDSTDEPALRRLQADLSRLLPAS